MVYFQSVGKCPVSRCRSYTVSKRDLKQMQIMLNISDFLINSHILSTCIFAQIYLSSRSLVNDNMAII